MYVIKYKRKTPLYTYRKIYKFVKRLFEPFLTLEIHPSREGPLTVSPQITRTRSMKKFLNIDKNERKGYFTGIVLSKTLNRRSLVKGVPFGLYF